MKRHRGTSRRGFVQSVAASLGAASTSGFTSGQPEGELPRLKPSRLRQGARVALVNPAGATFHSQDIAIVSESMSALGLEVSVGRHVLDRRGYFAGRDEDRAADLNEAFADPAVDAILCVRGGWGSARLLPLLDFEAIRKSPKVFVGYSDITALHLAIGKRTGLITFHGPVGISAWNPFTVEHFTRVLFDGDSPELTNPSEKGDHLTQVQDRIRTFVPGVAEGALVGGNLTVLTSIIGSDYLPDFEGKILFFEDVGEQIYRIDRMLTQLRLAGVLERLAGIVVGRCSDCDPGSGFGSLTLEEVFTDHLVPLEIPLFAGAMIGHINRQFTLPLGLPVRIDAERGSIRLMEPSVI